MSVKSERLSSDMQREISEIIRDEVKDQVGNFITITNVDLTPDLSFAKVYFTSLDKKPIEEQEKRLNHASSFIKTELGHRLHMRKNPDLRFIYDESIEYGKKIEEVISKIKED